MKPISILVFLAFTLQLIMPDFAHAAESFTYYMDDWNINIELASDTLKEAEEAFKEGDELQGRFNQRKAAEYGIVATKSLIKAFEVQGTQEDLSDIEAGLNKWKELLEFC